MSGSAEQKKEEFQKYLEKNGVIDSLTKVLVGLYELPEKPPSAVEFIKEYLGAAPASADVDKLTKTVADLQRQLAEKDKRIAELEAQVAASKPPA
jgi:hypothetical protein